MTLDPDRIDDATLALLALGVHEGRRAWKSFDWDALARLHAKGLIENPAGRAKSVVFTDEGLRASGDLLEQLLSHREAQQGTAPQGDC